MSFTPPYLIQRCTFRPTTEPDSKVSTQFLLDYMGSAEFEFGSVPQSIRAIGKAMSRGGMTIHETNIVNRRGQPLCVFCPNDIQDALTQWLSERATASEMDCDYSRLKESMQFWRWFHGTADRCFVNFWWAIDIHAAWGFDKSSVERFSRAIQASVSFMDARKK